MASIKDTLFTDVVLMYATPFTEVGFLYFDVVLKGAMIEKKEEGRLTCCAGKAIV